MFGKNTKELCNLKLKMQKNANLFTKIKDVAKFNSV